MATPPATAVTSMPVPPEAGSAPAQATAATSEERNAIHYGGFGTAAFGADESALRSAWGQPLEGMEPQAPGDCYYLTPSPRPQGGYGTAFMFEGRRFVRTDVDNPDIAAPGGGRIGMRAEELDVLYPGRIESRPHEYVEGGRYLRIRAADSAAGALVFETDAAGRVTRWRVGLAPQVDYVEGCS